jgi:hypothetical protein
MRADECDALWRSIDALSAKLDKGRPRSLKVIWVQFNGCATRDYDKDRYAKLVKRFAPDTTEVDVLCDMSNVRSFRDSYAAFFAGIELPEDSRYVRQVLAVVREAIRTHDVLLTGESYGGGIVNRVAEILDGYANAKTSLRVRTFGAAYIPPVALDIDAAHFVIKNDCIATSISRLSPPSPGGGYVSPGTEGRQIMWLDSVYDPTATCSVTHAARYMRVHSNGYQRIRSMAWQEPVMPLPDFVTWVNEQDHSLYGK